MFPSTRELGTPLIVKQMGERPEELVDTGKYDSGLSISVSTDFAYLRRHSFAIAIECDGGGFNTKGVNRFAIVDVSDKLYKDRCDLT